MSFTRYIGQRTVTASGILVGNLKSKYVLCSPCSASTRFGLILQRESLTGSAAAVFLEQKRFKNTGSKTPHANNGSNNNLQKILRSSDLGKKKSAVSKEAHAATATGSKVRQQPLRLPSEDPKFASPTLRLYRGGANFSMQSNRTKKIIFGWILISLIGAYLTQGIDDAPERSVSYLANPERFCSRLSSKNADDINYVLEALRRVVEFSDDVKMDFIMRSREVNLLLDIVENSDVVLDDRQKALAILNDCLQVEERATISAKNGYHSRIATLLVDVDKLYLRTMLALSVSLVAEDESTHVDIAKTGAIKMLDTMYSSSSLGRSSQLEALKLISYSCVEKNQERFDTMFDGEWELMSKYSEMYQRDLSKPYHELLTKIKKSGMLLYFHTGLGGLVWGVIEGSYAGNTTAHVAKYALRNALVSSMIPIYFVGASVALYQNLRKQCSEGMHIFVLNFTASMSLLPWYWILPRVERYSPYWIGGHCLGFLSFFTYLKLSKSDIFTNAENIRRVDNNEMSPISSALVTAKEIVDLDEKVKSNSRN